ncbi:enoyl-CoA delta isomerase 1, peroxisomal-like [Selaginella moellendorffii]|uniref:enoyl-CoA delta isomerase 1, peroxisomal-like n=1 Tax=Selaginella moellendorffii TaxID=88036 RepID=UPI000D1CC39D|nr:enoyl-CoA delta isomerase 1, peroxisomal-like [Selaginella moellendorffii]|eukprot:XP_024534872.1 enoyl-CoA delta isomerase 1, peroxisomal-like [Selaginella moellendorffii]
MCSLERQGQVAVLRLVGDGEHWLNPNLLNDILEALKVVQDSDARALVTTNDGNFFSNGLDLQWAKEDPPKRLPDLVLEMEKVVLAFMTLKVPTISCVCGHVCGARTSISMAHDYQYMRNDRGFWIMTPLRSNSMSMVPGYVSPPGSFTLARLKLTPRAYRDAFLLSPRLTARQAFEAGIIDKYFHTAQDARKAAMDLAGELADRNFNKDTYAIVRMTIYADAIKELDHEKARMLL